MGACIYTLDRLVNPVGLSTSRTIEATRRPYAVPACIEGNGAATINNAAARLVTGEYDWGACIYALAGLVSHEGLSTSQAHQTEGCDWEACIYTFADSRVVYVCPPVGS